MIVKTSFETFVSFCERYLFVTYHLTASRKPPFNMTERIKRKGGEETTKEVRTKAKQKNSLEISAGNSKKDQNKSKGKEKVFLLRNSVLTNLVENEHIRAIRNLLISFFIVWVLYITLGKYLKQNEFSIPGLEFLGSGYQGFSLAFSIWLAMFSSTIVFFGSFKTWAILKNRTRSSFLILDKFAAACAVFYITTFLVLPLYLTLTWDIGVMLRGGIAGEQIRMIMKVLAFISSKTPEYLDAANSGDKKKPPRELPASPNLKHFVYFMFAPTLIYSDTYPQTKRIRWSYVACYFAQMYACVFTGAVVLENTLIASTKDFGSRVPITFANFAYAVLYNTFPAFVILGLATYGLFHCMQNAVGELLRFGDRQFYLDWWTQSTCSGYFRNAHVLPQEWLNFYVYRPIKDVTNSRIYAQVGVFVLSGIVHELLFVAMFGFFYPVVFVAFVIITGPFVWFEPSNNKQTNSEKTAIGNLCFLLLYPIGVSFLEVALSVEFYARFNCPRTLDSATDFFIPRSWFCNQTILSNKDASDWSLI